MQNFRRMTENTSLIVHGNGCQYAQHFPKQIPHKLNQVVNLESQKPVLQPRMLFYVEPSEINLEMKKELMKWKAFKLLSGYHWTYDYTNKAILADHSELCWPLRGTFGNFFFLFWTFWFWCFACWNDGRGGRTIRPENGLILSIKGAINPLTCTMATFRPVNFYLKQWVSATQPSQ